MILNRFFDSKRDVAPYILVAILVFLLKYPQLTMAHSQMQMVDFWGIKYSFAVWAVEFFTAIIIIGQCIWANILFNKVKFMQSRTQIFALCYFILLAQNPVWIGWGWWHVALLMVLWVLDSWIKIGSNTHNATPIFGIGLRMGAALLFYPSMVVVLPLGVVALFFLNIFSVRRVLLFIFGCLAPVYFFGIFSYLFNKFPQFLAYTQATWRLNTYLNVGTSSLSKQVLLGSIVVVVVGIFMLNNVMQIKTGMVRAYSSFFSWCVFVICGLSLFYPDIFQSFILLVPFGAYFVACFFRGITVRWFAHDIAVVGLVAAVFLLQFYGK